MKICIWCTKIFDLGGTKRVVTLLANELVKEHDVTIMVYEDRFKEDRNMYHMSEDIKVDFIDNDFFVNRHHTPAFCWRYLVRKLNNKWGIFNHEKLNSVLADAIFPQKTQDKWVEYLNEQDYDIIITTASLSLRLGMLAPRLKAKTIGWQHNCFDGYLKVPNVVFWKQEALLQEYLPKLDRYIVLSDYDKRDYKKILGIVTEVKINPRSFVSEKKCDPEAKRFLMATRFVYAKGLDLMMEAFEKFCREDDEWQLDIIGSGDLWNEIVADAKRRHIEDRVNFVGYTNEPEKYYLNSSVFLLPSRWEGWPMVIMEAFEFGLPVIAFHTGAMDLIIDDGKTGFLPEAFDVDKFAQAMLKLAHDDELRRKMSRNAIWKSEDFAIEKAVSEWNHLFEELMRRGEFYEQNKKAILQCRYKYQMRTICAEYVKEYPVEEKTILYEAFGGRGMICNPYAIFKYLISEEKYRDYKHIWIIDDYLDNGEEIEKYKKYPNVKFVKYKSKEYCKAISTAKYLINNVSFPSYFAKRKEQVYLNTWHGTPFKYMGFDIQGAGVAQGNTAENLLNADYIVSSGSYMTRTAYENSYKLKNIYEGVVLEEGFPRNDTFFRNNREEILEKLHKCGINLENDKKIILYAPTWRGEKYSTPETEMETIYELIRTVRENIDSAKYQLIIKLHQIVYYHMKEYQVETGSEYNIFVPATMDTNELLAITDVLISDYSSIFYDFLNTDRSVLFYHPDKDDFEHNRGLYFEEENLPGPVAADKETLGGFLQNISSAVEPYQERYRQIKSQNCLWDDGHACERIAAAVFEGAKPENPVFLNKTSKIKILVYAGNFENTDQAGEFDEFLKSVDMERFDITLIGTGAENEKTAQKLEELSKKIRVLYWKPSYPATDEEYVCHDRFMKSESQDVPEMLEDFYSREFGRLTGKSQFNYVAVFTERKEFFPVMSKKIQVKRIFTGDNWREILKL